MNKMKKKMGFFHGIAMGKQGEISMGFRGFEEQERTKRTRTSKFRRLAK